jgi:2-succinyl-6-hydroxy-2,4-cyclohexadiene-1-carboxylate synthase
MIWALHGMVGEPSDWDFLKPSIPNLQAPLLWAEVDHYRPWAEQFTERVRAADPAPVVMGYSMGGRLALHALVAAPDLFRAAVIVSAHPGITDRRLRQIRWRQDDEWAAKIRSVPWLTFLKIWNDQAVFDGAPAPGERLTTFRWRQGIIRSFDCWGLSRQEDLVPKLAGLRTPVLWVTGENDRGYSALAATAVAVLGRGRHETIPGAGHRVPWEAPVDFAGRVCSFLSRECLLS